MCAERLGLLLAVMLGVGCASSSMHQNPRDTLAFGPFATTPQIVRVAPEGETGSSLATAEDQEPLLRRREPVADDGEEGERPSPRAAKGMPPVACGGKAVPLGWPHRGSSREVLEPFMGCASPTEFVVMQRGVDMAALVESLTDWDAVRLGALGPLDERASESLGRKRAAFLVESVEKYGVPYAEVLALFVLHAAFDDELREVVRRLAREKQLGETLGPMSAVRQELKRRGLELEGVAERGEQARDVLRGLGRAGRELLSSTLASGETRYTELMALRGQMPPPYQAALDEVGNALMEEHYAPGSVSMGAFDSLTFGVPLGFYHLVVGTGHGAYSLAQGRYEQATRELAPAALMVALYAGGKGARALTDSASGARTNLRRLSAPDVEALKSIVKELEVRFGPDAVREVFSLIRGNREVARFAAMEGAPGVMALHDAQGNLPKAQATLTERYREPTSASAMRGGVEKRSGGRATLPPEAVGLSAEVAEAKLRQAEAEAGGARLPMDVGFLRRHREALLKVAPPGAEVHARWPDYLSYLERRTEELGQRQASKGPLEWGAYQVMRDRYARGLAFERTMVAILREDAARPRAQRIWLEDFDQPRIETHVGVSKADLRFADVLVIEEGPAAGPTPRVETFSFKSRDLSLADRDALASQMTTDAGHALRYYGESLSILRDGIRQQAHVQRVRLVYEGGPLLPKDPQLVRAAMATAKRRVEGVEVRVE
ncbi:hypothetical protein [Myxococcus fulvus]|uniref:hypothetical protein n=1 Tax=Myxococcus fulvus TaxID=33 RepID=UPI0020BEDE90|nr:hypothetical protein [Myxococcus fulvus]MCK8499675.1 hypothetical protein [Myxococcus fulvus]